MRTQSFIFTTSFLLLAATNTFALTNPPQFELKIVKNHDEVVLSKSVESKSLIDTKSREFYFNHLERVTNRPNKITASEACYVQGKMNRDSLIGMMKFVMLSEGEFNSKTDEFVLSGGNGLTISETDILNTIDLPSGLKLINNLEYWMSKFPSGVNIIDSVSMGKKTQEACLIEASAYIVGDRLRIYVKDQCYNGGGVTDYIIHPCSN